MRAGPAHPILRWPYCVGREQTVVRAIVEPATGNKQQYGVSFRRFLQEVDGIKNIAAT
jgi:hypothetical protein